MTKVNIKLIYVEFDFDVDGKDFEIHINLKSREYSIDDVNSSKDPKIGNIPSNQVITADYAKSLLEKHLKSV